VVKEILMHRGLIRSFVLLGWLVTLRGVAQAEVTAEKSERGVVVKIDGELFTEYLTKAGQAPAMWPLIGPTGALMTRSWPVAPAPNGVKETDDHPHHQSVWFTHDKVNGVDFWKANVKAGSTEQGARSPSPELRAPSSKLPASPGPHIAHREFVEIKNEGATARLITRNDWMNGDKRICEDKRIIVFGTRLNKDRWIDFTITIKASDGDVTFGDTKEGTFAVRVADPMRVDAKLGGRIVNSDGLVDEAAWGIPAKWVDYTGPVAASLRDADARAESRQSDDLAIGQASPNNPRLGETRPQEILGIAIMSHPKSFRPTPRWHVRTYGLFTANPFGKREFPKPEAYEQGPTTIRKGDSLTLRYRILLHSGATDKANIEAAFEEFAAK
jgi:hypothetical protein